MIHRHLQKHLGLAGVIIILVTVLVVAGFSKSRKGGAATDTTNPQNQKAPGSMRIEAEFNQKIYTVGEKVNLWIYADSARTRVSGYDSVVTYNPDILSYVSADNLLATFDFFTEEKDGKVSLTGVRKITDTTKEPVFSQTALARLTFTILKSDTFEVKLVQKPGATNESNLVTADASDILGSTKGFVGYIGKSVKLQKGKPATIPDTDLKLTLSQVELPKQPCADCQEVVTISVAQGTQEQTLKFTSGGFDGAPFESMEAFGMLFEIESGYNAQAVTIRYAEKK